MRIELLIFGASGHARVVADIIRLAGEYQIVGFLDDVNPQRHGAPFCSARILGGREQLDNLKTAGVEHIILGFGNCRARLALSELVRARGYQLATALHPSAIIARDAQISAGAVVAAGVVINPGAFIGENTIINTAASIDHDCSIEDGAHISPGVHLAGHASVGRGSWVGIGATVIDRVHIGAGSIIGAGAVVTRDIPDGVLAYGAPARVIRQLDYED